ncbi:hypothetical protein EU663_27145, partial [Escherichia coli]|nr:hypothetical protein [Escherichia coli]
FRRRDPPVSTLVPSFTTSVWLSLMILCHSILGKMISNERFSRTVVGCQPSASKAWRFVARDQQA